MQIPFQGLVRCLDADGDRQNTTWKAVREEMKLCQFIYDLNSVEIIHYIKHAMQPVIPKDALISCWCSLKQPNLVPTGDTTQYTTF